MNNSYICQHGTEVSEKVTCFQCEKRYRDAMRGWNIPVSGGGGTAGGPVRTVNIRVGDDLNDLGERLGQYFRDRLDRYSKGPEKE